MKLFVLDNMLDFALSEIRKTADNAIPQDCPVESRYIGGILHTHDYVSTFDLGFENPNSHSKFVEAVGNCQPITKSAGDFSYLFFPNRTPPVQILTDGLLYVLRKQMKLPNNLVNPTLYVLAKLSDIQPTKEGE